MILVTIYYSWAVGEIISLF
jgi:hypothetical protein